VKHNMEAKLLISIENQGFFDREVTDSGF